MLVRTGGKHTQPAIREGPNRSAVWVPAPNAWRQQPQQQKLQQRPASSSSGMQLSGRLQQAWGQQQKLALSQAAAMPGPGLPARTGPAALHAVLAPQLRPSVSPWAPKVAEVPLPNPSLPPPPPVAAPPPPPQHPGGNRRQAAPPTAPPAPPPGTHAKRKKRPSRLKRAFQRGRATQEVARWLGVLCEVEEALQAAKELLGAIANELQALRASGSGAVDGSQPTGAVSRVHLLELIMERGKQQEEELVRAHLMGRQQLEKAQAAMLALQPGAPAGSEPTGAGAQAASPGPLAQGATSHAQPALSTPQAGGLGGGRHEQDPACSPAAAVIAVVAPTGSGCQAVANAVPAAGRAAGLPTPAAPPAAAASREPVASKPILHAVPPTAAQQPASQDGGALHAAAPSPRLPGASHAGSLNGDGSCSGSSSDDDQSGLDLNWGDALAGWMLPQLRAAQSKAAVPAPPQAGSPQRAGLVPPRNGSAAAAIVSQADTIAPNHAPAKVVSAAAKAVSQPVGAAVPTVPMPAPVAPSHSFSAASTPSSSEAELQWGDTLASWMPPQLQQKGRQQQAGQARVAAVLPIAAPIQPATAPPASCSVANSSSPLQLPAAAIGLAGGSTSAVLAGRPGTAGHAHAAAATACPPAAAALPAALPLPHCHPPSDASAAHPPFQPSGTTGVEAGEMGGRSEGGEGSSGSGSDGEDESGLSMEWGDTLKAWAASMKVQSMGMLHSLAGSQGDRVPALGPGRPPLGPTSVGAPPTVQGGKAAEGGAAPQGPPLAVDAAHAATYGKTGRHGAERLQAAAAGAAPAHQCLPAPAPEQQAPASAVADDGEHAGPSQPGAPDQPPCRASPAGSGGASGQSLPGPPSVRDAAACALAAVQSWLDSSEPAPPDNPTILGHGAEEEPDQHAQQARQAQQAQGGQPLESLSLQQGAAGAAGQAVLGMGEDRPEHLQQRGQLPKGAILCSVCQVAVSGESNYQQHLASRRHAKQLGQLAAHSMPQQGTQAVELAAQQAQQRPKAYIGPAAADVAPYVDQVISEELNDVALQLLQRLLGWQERVRLADPHNYRRKRRLVSGMREVGKVVKTKKAKALLVAPNISAVEGDGENGAEYPVAPLLQMAREREVPVLFALSRQRMGKVFGPASRKRVSAFAILDFDGANDLFRRLLALAEEGRVQWQNSRRQGDAAADAPS